MELAGLYYIHIRQHILDNPAILVRDDACRETRAYLPDISYFADLPEIQSQA